MKTFWMNIKPIYKHIIQDLSIDFRHWVKAFKMQEEKDLANLDPNSEDALRYCKYLRLNRFKTR